MCEPGSFCYFKSMTIEIILKRIRAFYRKTGKAPKTRDLKNMETECFRKIGSWRKALWLAGVLQEARKKKMPQLDFVQNKNDLKPKSLRKLQKTKIKNPHKKEKLKT